MPARTFAELQEHAKKVADPYSHFKVEAKKASREPTKKRYYYGQAPERLLTSREVSFPARTIFGILHCRCSKKDLASQPVVQVSMKELCRAAGRGETLVRKWLRELEKARWIDIIHRGVHRENQYRLYESPQIDRREAVKRKLRDPAIIKRLTPKT